MQVSSVVTFVLAAMAATSVLAQPPPSSASYVFDTVTAVEVANHPKLPSVTGLAKDTGQVITATFREFSSDSNRCLPIFLTAMEKPGRYFLHVTLNLSTSEVSLMSCRLELKS